MGARDYDPTFGRFITRDTDLSQSPYAYCDGDPVDFNDPSGHKITFKGFLTAVASFNTTIGNIEMKYGTYVAIGSYAAHTANFLFIHSPALGTAASWGIVGGVGLLFDGASKKGWGLFESRLAASIR